MRAETLIGWVRRLTPAFLVPAVIRLWAALGWRRTAVRDDARRQMGFLVGDAHPELDALARDYAFEMARRGELRWHPRLANDVRLEGAEHLLAAAAPGRGVVLSFMHHGLYDRSFTAVGRLGLPLSMVVHPYMLGDDAPGWIRQHVRVNTQGGGAAVSAEIGTAGMADLLARGGVVALASDVPGRTPVTFAGRRVLGSFGAARIAADNGAPVVVMTSARDEHGEVLRLHPALDPSDFASPHDLLTALLAQHEAAILAWPEATDLPCSRWEPAVETAPVP